MFNRMSDEQKTIVLCPPDRHAIVRAVAGSGKSTVLVERLAYLYEVHRVKPSEILAVMFNRDAAIQLTERLYKRLGKANAPQSITYHGLGTQLLSILTREGKAPAWKFEANPDSASRFAYNTLNALMDKHSVRRKRKVVDLFMGFVDRVKGDMVSPGEAFRASDDYSADLEWFIGAYELYERERQRRKLRFFSDLIYDPLVIIKNDPEAAQMIANRFEHIVVDEYQDICEAQQQLVNVTAGNRAKVMVVGDDDQTIYTWRGAQPSYILYKFAELYPDPIEFKLSRTWRYGHLLSLIANNVIANNSVRAPKLCVSGAKAQTTTVQLKAIDPSSQPDPNERTVVLPSIKEWMKFRRQAQLSDIAILFRTYGRSGQVQLELLNAGIPFRMAGPPTAVIFQNTWVTYLLGWLRLAAGDFASVPYRGEPDSGSISQVMVLVSPVWLEGLSWPESRTLATQLLKNPQASVTIETFITQEKPPAFTYSRLRNMGLVWDYMRGLASGKTRYSSALPEEFRTIDPDSASTLFRFVFDFFQVGGVIQQRTASTSAAEDNILMVEALGNYIEQAGYTIEQALTHIQHLINFSERSLKAVDAITVTSVHRSKGLEWPCVIMPDLRQGWFPHVRGGKTGRPVFIEGPALEDERRLFYVAMTRACERLILIHPPDPDLDTRKKIGSTELPPSLAYGINASQFLYEANIDVCKLAAQLIIPGKTGPEILKPFRNTALIRNYLSELDKS